MSFRSSRSRQRSLYTILTSPPPAHPMLMYRPRSPLRPLKIPHLRHSRRIQYVRSLPLFYCTNVRQLTRYVFRRRLRQWGACHAKGRYEETASDRDERATRVRTPDSPPRLPTLRGARQGRGPRPRRLAPRRGGDHQQENSNRCRVITHPRS